MNYNVDSNTKSLNYSKIRIKPLIYFELQEFELKLWIKATSHQIPIKCPSNWWNFELTVFKLTVHFKHEMIGISPNIHNNFELSGTSN